MDKTSLFTKTGLTSKEAEELLKQYGPNVLPEPPRATVLKIFLRQFKNFFVYMHFAAVVLAYLIGHLRDALLILAILVVNGALGFYQEFKAEKAAVALKSFIVHISRVVRDGREKQIETSKLVRGDLIIVEEGLKIPVDARLVEAVNLAFNEASLTGESEIVRKSLSENLIYAGTTCVSGRGRAVVLETGARTKLGEIAKGLTEIERPETGLEKDIRKIGLQFTLAAVLGALILVGVNLYQGYSLEKTLLVGVSLLVAAVPEALPAVVTLSLSLGLVRLAKQKAIVRKLSAIETLGRVEIICTDKTGTLTENRMKIVKIWTEGRIIDFESPGFQLKPDDRLPVVKILEAGILTNSASLVLADDHKKFEVLGDQTEGAFLLLSEDLKIETEGFKFKRELSCEFNFEPSLKIKSGIWGGEIFVKGAPETVLAKSAYFLDEGGKRLVTEKLFLELEAAYRNLAAAGLRVIAVASRKLTENEAGKIKEEKTAIEREKFEKGLTLLGFAGISDPVRLGVAGAVREAGNLGVETVMITGDNEYTALTIAREIGLSKKGRGGEIVLTGEVIKKLNEAELISAAGKTSVFARIEPEQKLKLVEVFQKMGKKVAVTGDGVNDALALARADCGLAMGLSGTDAARDASDVVISDDNYATIVAAIKEGRLIYENIFRAIKYLLIGNFGEIVTIVVTPILGLPNPLSATQILFINLVTDSLPAFILASNVVPRKMKPVAAYGVDFKVLVFFGSLIGVLTIAAYKLALFSGWENMASNVALTSLIILHISVAGVLWKK